MRSSVNPFMAAASSLAVPGLGQWLLGERAKGLVLLCMTLGIALSAAFIRSTVTKLLMALVYVAVAVPAALDAFRSARGHTGPAASDRRGYVIWMLLAVGPFAVPLLWSSARFSRSAKIGWTAAILLIALLVIITAAALGPALEQLSAPAGEPLWPLQ